MPARCFVAVPLGERALALVADARRVFLDVEPSWSREKWVRPEVVHLTLKYVGPLSDAHVDDALQVLADECAAHAPFQLALAGAHAVPTHERARMLWATLDGDTRRCAWLAAAISHALAEGFGVPRDDRSFIPHVTLARARQPRPASADAVAAASAALTSGKETDGIVSVRYVTLYASTSGPGGPVYEELGAVPLRG